MYNNFSSKKTKKVISALLASALVVTSAPITANAATAKVLGVGKTFTVKKTTKVSGLSKAEKKIVKVTVNKKKRTVTVKGLKAGKATFKIGKKAYTVKVGATSIAKKTVTTSMTAGETKTLSVKASNGKGDTIQFTSSKKGVVKVNKASVTASKKTGVAATKVTAVAEGTAKITAKSKFTGKSKAFTITVKAAATPTPATQPPTVATTPAATGTATTAPGTSNAPGTTNAPGTSNAPGTATATPGTATATPGTDATQAPGTDGTPAPGETAAPEVKAALVDAYVSGTNTVQINFSNKISAPTTANVSIEGATVESVALSEDQKSIIATVSGLTAGKQYSVKVTGIVDANGEAVADAETSFTARKVQYAGKLKVYDVETGEEINEIKADGQTQAKVEFTLYDDAGNVIKDKAEVQFTTTAGNFAEKKVSAQNGVATNMFTSEVSATKKEAYMVATVVASDNEDLINLTQDKRLSMNPNVSTEKDTTVGVSLTDVMVETNDRVILYFNKDVNVTDYTYNTVTEDDVFGYDASKMTIKIKNNAGTSDSITDNDPDIREPYALAKVPGDSKALYAILKTDTEDEQYLTDNAKIVVQVTDNTKSIPVKETKSALVTDIRVPSMLSVENPNKSLKKIQITFSEPIQNKVGSNDGVNNAEKLSKWVIDSTNLDNDKYGTSTGDGEKATVEVGTFNKKTGKDERNIVTITLGKNKDGDQIYFRAGSHSVQGNNIGDWANMTDTQNNIINTQTLDFTIEANTEAPTAEVKVESPEQYYLKFNTAVEKSDLQDKVKDIENLKLQQYKDGSWVNVSGNPINVRPVTDSEGTEYIVELTKDWTEILDIENTHKNYYNYDFRLHLDKETIKNASNGIKNAEINLDLNGDIMDTPDVTSPTLKDATEDSAYVLIDFSEPVQIPGFTGHQITATEKQGTLSQPTVQFISEDNTTTINGTISKVNDHDTQISVMPANKLSAGTWKVVVRSVSDDVGNTATTLVKEDFKVEGTVVVADTSFKALWAVAVPNGRVNPLTNGVTSYTEDIIYIKFNDKFKTYGSAANAGATTNYTVNGYSVPSTSKIDSSLQNYNHNANIKNNYTDLVAIHLAAGTLTNTSNQINISKTIESVVGTALSNGGLKLLSEVNNGQYFAWNYAEYTTATPIKTVDGLQNALNDGAYYKYDLAQIAASTLNLSGSAIRVPHAVTVDFNNKFVKELNIKTNETGIIRISNVKANIINVDAPNADVYINGAEVVKANGVSNSGNINVINVLEGTLRLEDVTAEKIAVTDSDGASIVTKGINTINEIEIATSSKLGLNLSNETKDSEGNLVNVSITSPVKLEVDGNLANLKLDVAEKAKTLTITKSSRASNDVTFAPTSKVQAGDISIKTDDTIKIEPIGDETVKKIVPTVTKGAENITIVSGTAVSVVATSASAVTASAVVSTGTSVTGKFTVKNVLVTVSGSAADAKPVAYEKDSSYVLKEGDKVQVVYKFTPDDAYTYDSVDVKGNTIEVRP